MDVLGPIIVALIGLAGLVFGVVFPLTRPARQNGRELLARTETSNGKTIAQQVEEIGVQVGRLPTKADVDRIERKLDEHADGVGHPALVELIGRMRKRERP